MAFRMDALGLGGGPKQLGDIDKTILFRLLGEGLVFLVGLTFAGKCFLEIFSRCGHFYLLGVFECEWKVCRYSIIDHSTAPAAGLQGQSVVGYFSMR